jgi:murein DD-endopeptidase MepM/ murein hydrolase activator NlpD
MSFEDFIKDNRAAFRPMFEPVLTDENTVYMELSTASNAFAGMNETEIDAAVFEKIEDAGAIAGVGGYLENRSVYRDTELFRGDEERCIHIGVDVFMPSETPIFAPLDGEVQSFANRQLSGDYGPVIILRHRLNDFEFHSLYGHLAQDSLDGLYDGKPVASGEKIAAIGPRPVNGNWTPHLHFQLIQDMQDYRGDYPGVVRPADVDFFKQNCPDPSILIVA